MNWLIIRNEDNLITDCICPNCGFDSTIAVPVRFNFCPNCGIRLFFDFDKFKCEEEVTDNKNVKR